MNPEEGKMLFGQGDPDIQVAEGNHLPPPSISNGNQGSAGSSLRPGSTLPAASRGTIPNAGTNAGQTLFPEPSPASRHPAAAQASSIVSSSFHTPENFRQLTPCERGPPSSSSDNRYSSPRQASVSDNVGGNHQRPHEGKPSDCFRTPLPVVSLHHASTSSISSPRAAVPRCAYSSSLSGSSRGLPPPATVVQRSSSCTAWTSSTPVHGAAVGQPMVSPIAASSTSQSCCNVRVSSGLTLSTPATGIEAEQGGDDEEEEDMEEGDVQSLGRRACLESSTDESQVFLSVVWYGGKLGVAYYDGDTLQVHVMLDSMETDDFCLLKTAIKQLQPSRIVLSSKQDERLMKMLREEIGIGSGSDLDRAANNVLQCLPNSDFSLELSRQRILSMNLPSVPDHFTDTERMLHFSSLLPMDNSSMVKALGGLLKFLEKMRVGVELEDASIRVPILGIRVFSLDDYMIVDDTAYSALQIFQKESHPSAFKAGTSNSAKEGLSLFASFTAWGRPWLSYWSRPLAELLEQALKAQQPGVPADEGVIKRILSYVMLDRSFGIMNRCKSGVGAKKLRLWFLRPLKSISQIRQRQDAVTFFLQPRNMELVSCLQDCLRYIKNVPKILSRMVQTKVGRADWFSLYKTAFHSIDVREFCRKQQQPIALFKKIAEAFTDDLFKLASLVSDIVDFEELSMAREFVVRQGVNAELDHKKRVYHGLPDLMTKVAREELNNLNNEITECSVTYMPQLGYLLAVPDTEELAEKKYLLPGMDFVFLSNKICHFKTASMKELDAMVGDIQVEITDHETVILHRLQKTVLEHTDLFLHVVDYTAELDCILALAVCAREFNYVQPELVTEDVFEINGGRHPLQELCCSPFVPNDVHSSCCNQSSKVKILTGPNASGKSVYLKQVALIVFLAQIGSYVPAERAVVGVVDRIFTRIKSLESVSVGLSTFMLDVNQMSEALQRSTKRSLVLVDEFGKGTEAVDGLALLCSCLHYWVRQGVDCPHVFVCTHFHSIVTQRMLPHSSLISYLTMETVLDGEDLVFLYQLKSGHTSSSYASHIALQAGLPGEVVERGKKVSELIRLGQSVERVDTTSTVSHLQRCEKIVERFLELDLDTGDVHGFLEEVKAMST